MFTFDVTKCKIDQSTADKNGPKNVTCKQSLTRNTVRSSGIVIFFLYFIVVFFTSLYLGQFQANCIDSTAKAEAVFAGEVQKLKSEKIKPREQITLEPYERDHAVVVGQYR